MTIFADSSALVKLYADEDGHEAIRAISSFVVGALARVEVPAAIWRKHRMGELSANQTSVLVGEFEADYFGTSDEPARFAAIAATPAVLDKAAYLAGTHGLRGYDSVHLASAVLAREADPDCIVFAAFDHELRAAAVRQRFTLVP